MHNDPGTVAHFSTNIVAVDNDDTRYRDANEEGLEQDDNVFGEDETDNVANDDGGDEFYEPADVDDNISGKSNVNDLGVYDVWNAVLFVGRESVNAVTNVVSNLNAGTSSVGEPRVNVGSQEIDVHSLSAVENENDEIGYLIGSNECVNNEEVEGSDKIGREVQETVGGYGEKFVVFYMGVDSISTAHSTKTNSETIEKAMVVCVGDTGSHPDVQNDKDVDESAEVEAEGNDARKIEAVGV